MDSYTKDTLLIQKRSNHFVLLFLDFLSPYPRLKKAAFEHSKRATKELIMTNHSKFTSRVKVAVSFLREKMRF